MYHSFLLIGSYSFLNVVVCPSISTCFFLNPCFFGKSRYNWESLSYGKLVGGFTLLIDLGVAISILFIPCFFAFVSISW